MQTQPQPLPPVSEPLARRPDAATRQAADHLLLRLACLDLSASGFRVLLFLCAKAEATGRRDWAWPVEAIAETLHLHRNSVSRGLAELQKAGFIRRTAVLRRGAPTRTVLLLDPLALDAMGSDCPAQRLQASPLSSSMTKDEISSAPIVSPPCDTEAAPARVEEPRDVISAGPPPAPTPPAPRKRSPDELTRMLDFFRRLKDRCPAAEAALSTASDHKRPLAVDPAWNLTDEETRWLQDAVPKPEPRPAPNLDRPLGSSGEVAPAEVAAVLLPAIPRIADAVGGEGRAAELLDEIAYMVVRGGLGRGSLAGGARAGLSIVRKGLWKRPAGMSDAWRGSVLRGATAVTDRLASVH